MRRLAPWLIPMLAALALAAGCSSTSTTSPPAPVPPAPPPPPAIKEAPLPVRANLRAELAAGYYERGQMDIALQELAEAVKLDPTNPKIYNVYGLVYATLGQDADAAQELPQGAGIGAQRLGVPAELGLVPVHACAGEASRSPNSSGR